MNSNNKTSFEELLEEAESFIGSKTKQEKLEFDANALQLDIMHQIQDLMVAEGISRKQLADLLGKSKSFISQLFSCDKSLNLKTIVQFQEIFNKKFIPVFKEFSYFSKKFNFNKNDYYDSNYNTPVQFIFDIKDGKPVQTSKAA